MAYKTPVVNDATGRIEMVDNVPPENVPVLPGPAVACAWPVGSVFISVVSTNPATLLGFGTWAAFAAGRVLVGLDAAQTEFDAVEETGGSKTVSAAGSVSAPVFTGSALAAHSHELPFQIPSTTTTRQLAAATFGSGTSRAATAVSAAGTANTTSAAVALSESKTAGTPIR